MKPLLVFSAATLLSLGACNTAPSGDTAVATDGTLPADSRASDAATAAPIVYKATANGMADIEFTIAPAGTFSLWMEIYPQFESGDELEEVAYSGTWTREGNWVELTFVGDIPKPNSLFDTNYADANQFQVVDERRVRVNTGRETPTIWGVDCERTAGG